MSDQPTSFPDDDVPDANQPDSLPIPEELSPGGDKDDDAAESPEVRQMEEEAVARRSQPSGKTAKAGSWIILAVVGTCLIVALVVVVARFLR
jgi:cobalamin biosynthesis Mg chelatase CobN